MIKDVKVKKKYSNVTLLLCYLVILIYVASEG